MRRVVFSLATALSLALVPTLALAGPPADGSHGCPMKKCDCAAARTQGADGAKTAPSGRDADRSVRQSAWTAP